jgi:hypothetical protein
VVLVDHEEATKTLSMGADLETEHVFELQPVMVARTLTSTPGDAQLKLDGEVVGRTPLEHAFQAGLEVRVHVDKRGYYAREVRYREGYTDPSVLAVTLKPVPPPGKLIVDSLYNDLDIRVDGRRYQDAEIELPPGSHTVELKSARVFYAEKKTIELASKQTVRLETPLVMTIPRIETIGGYVHLKINGMYVEQEGRKDTTPIVNLRIAAGTHEFEFVSEDGKILVTKEIEVNKRENIVVVLDNP